MPCFLEGFCYIKPTKKHSFLGLGRCFCFCFFAGGRVLGVSLEFFLGGGGFLLLLLWVGVFVVVVGGCFCCVFRSFFFL